MRERSIRPEDDLFKKFNKEHKEVSDSMSLAMAYMGSDRHIGADGRPIYLSTLLTELACIKYVCLLEHYIQRLAQLNDPEDRFKSQNLEKIEEWLKQKLSIDIKECINPKELALLKKLFAHRHIIVHNMSKCDEKFLREARKHYEEMGWQEVEFPYELGEKAVFNPSDVEPMGRLIYRLVEGIHTKYRERDTHLVD